MSSSNKFSQGDSRSIDHISIVSEAEERHISVVEKLQARIAELERINSYNKLIVDSYKDQIAELESLIDDMASGEYGGYENQIKAKGIREMLSDWYENGFEKLYEHAKHYADKLEKGND